MIAHSPCIAAGCDARPTRTGRMNLALAADGEHRGYFSSAEIASSSPHSSKALMASMVAM